MQIGRPRVLGVLGVLCSWLGALACGGSHVPATPRTIPAAADVRQEVLREFGQRLYQALAAGTPEVVVYDDRALGELLEPEAATQARALRSAPLGLEPARLAVLADAAPTSLCIQGGGETGAHGLRARAWTFERALVAGTRPGGRQLAAWVEGTFVLSDQGFGAIALRRVEDPRWEHSDLELATCDMRVELGTPQDVVVVTR
ncbi:MAG: hypothetical protein KF901_08325 [Myxococcales bacterium]|nr:hypothetical protein [Myxococcales bacterium]